MEKMTKRYFLITHRRKEKKNISKVRAQKKRKENREEEKLFMENSSLKDSRNSAHVTLDTKISKKKTLFFFFSTFVCHFSYGKLSFSLFSLYTFHKGCFHLNTKNSKSKKFSHCLNIFSKTEPDSIVVFGNNS
jgi:hypothetical protein